MNNSDTTTKGLAFYEQTPLAKGGTSYLYHIYFY